MHPLIRSFGFLFSPMLLALLSGAMAVSAPPSCEQWGVFEVELEGPATGNPFLGVELSATFSHDDQSITAAGFYDGDGVYRVRFSPPSQGKWKYRSASNAVELDGKSGEFEATAPGAGNHGPVEVAHEFHFAYADGSPYKPIGTTCYAWTSQPESLQRQTLKTLSESPFNKLRMCVFPKRYTWNQNDPSLYAFEGTPPNQWDFSRYNPKFFQHLEKQIVELAKQGVQADLILLHPYDDGRWGFDRMSDDADDRYLRYVVSRLAAYRNVWWSLANEWDFMKHKQESDWDRMIQVVSDADPYRRLTSIHNGYILYNHNNPLLTHASIQNGSAAEEAGRAVLYRDAYRKPIVLDEVKYEGDIPLRWGNLSAEEMVHRFWEGTVAGCYVTHGECYLSDDDVLWWAKGGVLKGESPARIAFLRDVLLGSPASGLNPIDKWQAPNICGKPAEYYLVYFGTSQPKTWEFSLPRHELEDGMTFKAEVLDTWNMTTTPVDGEFHAKSHSQYEFKDAEGRSIDLPGKPYIALRITRADHE
ncbi:Putative endoglucanase [Pirellulimonas nuda]|uniref:Endoglucanase n=1 Tax=Pirellulimonas nuda TaxID=2528009 RepID=A0A518DG17_9BACT|nr:DUF5060 domain-containing protein [Pirellulimonas nuda]QDU90411.1 Putative endoglucanase [Pirellulimonas nuda]